MTEREDKEKKKFAKMDWRIELARIIAIGIIIIFHILLFTEWVGRAEFHKTWPFVIALGCFFYCSGNVQGLKDEFNKPGSLTIKKYFKYVKNRFLRLYIGYYLGLGGFLIAKLIAGKPIIITPWTLFLDLTSLWPLLTGNAGGIWPEGWFVGALLLVSLIYPFLRRMKKNRPQKESFFLQPNNKSY